MPIHGLRATGGLDLFIALPSTYWNLDERDHEGACPRGPSKGISPARSLQSRVGFCYLDDTINEGFGVNISVDKRC